MIELVNLYGAIIRQWSLFGLYYLKWVGLGATLVFLIHLIPDILHFLYVGGIRRIFGDYTDFLEMGRWAVVTGASDGIGKAYAEELKMIQWSMFFFPGFYPNAIYQLTSSLRDKGQRKFGGKEEEGRNGDQIGMTLDI